MGPREIKAFIFILIPGLILLFFQNRFVHEAGLALSFILYLAAFRVGRILSRVLDSGTSESLFMPLGLGVLLLVLYPLFCLTTNRSVLIALWICLGFLASLELPQLFARKLPSSILLLIPALILVCWSAATPATFFDTLVYHLGLAQQYFARGKIVLLPNHLYSAFPPFEAVKNILFVSVNVIAGIKFFDVFLLLQMAWVLTFPVESTTEQRTVIPLLVLMLFPAAWILLHLTTADLLASLFFVGGIRVLNSANSEALAAKNCVTAALLTAFAVWTKSNVYLFLPFTILFFLPLTKKAQFRNALIYYGFLIAIVAPFLIRNWLALNDPFYPALAGFAPDRYWSAEQTEALRKDSFPSGSSTIFGLFSSVWTLAFAPHRLGSAAASGILYPLSAILYLLLARPRTYWKFILFVLASYVAWYFVFPNFRQVLPAYFLLQAPAVAFLALLRKRSKLLFGLFLLLSFLITAVALIPVYRDYFPLIKRNHTEEEYLQQHVRYYGIARFLNQRADHYGVIQLGLTQLAYLNRPVITGTAYNRSPFLLYAAQSRDPDDLLKQLKALQIKYFLYDPEEFARLSKKTGLWEISPQVRIMLSEFAKKHMRAVAHSNNITLFELH